MDPRLLRSKVTRLHTCQWLLDHVCDRFISSEIHNWSCLSIVVDSLSLYSRHFLDSSNSPNPNRTFFPSLVQRSNEWLSIPDRSKPYQTQPSLKIPSISTPIPDVYTCRCKPGSPQYFHASPSTHAHVRTSSHSHCSNCPLGTVALSTSASMSTHLATPFHFSTRY